VKDVSSGFGTESLRTTLLKPGSGYTCSIDYKVFGCSEAVNYSRTTTSTASATKIFVSDLPRSATSVVDYDKDTQVV
jgi:hypothetical protein